MNLKRYISSAAMCAALFTANTANAQWTHTGAKTYLNNPGDSVGIGTTNPAYKLDVQATGIATMQFKSATNNASILLDRGSATSTSSLTYRTSGINTWQTGIIGNANYNIRNSGLASVAITVLASNNNVGIGIANPTQKLDVVGNINSSGSISSATLLIGTTTAATGFIANIGGKLIAEEVRVDLKASWPDYVFAKDYKLMSFEELEISINTYQHLPGIPSAAEVKQNGITLGEMLVHPIEKGKQSIARTHRSFREKIIFTSS